MIKDTFSQQHQLVFTCSRWFKMYPLQGQGVISKWAEDGYEVRDRKRDRERERETESKRK